jgi:hypothetical protein
MVLYLYMWSSKIIFPFFYLINILSVHPHYVGVTEIEYAPEKKQLQVACKWFVDDLEEALRSTGSKYDITRQYKQIGQDSAILSYIKKHIQVNIDGNAFDLIYIGAEIEKGSVWTYWSIHDISRYKSVRFSNNMFCEKHADQIHLVHFTQNNIRESRKLTCKEPAATFIWK